MPYKQYRVATKFWGTTAEFWHQVCVSLTRRPQTLRLVAGGVFGIWARHILLLQLVLPYRQVRISCLGVNGMNVDLGHLEFMEVQQQYYRRHVSRCMSRVVFVLQLPVFMRVSNMWFGSSAVICETEEH